MKQTAIALLACVAAGLCQAKDTSVTGILIQGNASNATYLAVEPEEPIIETSPAGEKTTAHRLQIPGCPPNNTAVRFGCSAKWLPSKAP